MWFAILGAVITVFGLGMLYLSFRAAGLPFIRRLAGGRRWAARLIALAFLILLTVILSLIWDVVNALICVIHLVAFWLICDLLALIVSKIRHRETPRSLTAAAAVIFCVLYLAVGWVSAHHVWETSYELESDRLSGDLRIVQVTDSHLGAIIDAEGMARYAEEISSLSPDLVVVTGDFVDDDTSREDLLGGCAALGAIRSTYGVFFVYGNHDRGYFDSSSRGWNAADLRSELEKNGVTILEDESVLVDGRFYVVGRKDRSAEGRGDGRLTAEALLSGLDPDLYKIVLDHQPHDFDAEAAAGSDLVLCGHTHGGQFIPINYVGEWIGENERSYGLERRGGTVFIVSSGISNWTFQFKTGCRSEIVIVDIHGTE